MADGGTTGRGGCLLGPGNEKVEIEDDISGYLGIHSSLCFSQNIEYWKDPVSRLKY